MYSIIVCPECESAVIVEDSPETATCRCCSNRLRFRKLKTYHSTESLDEAQEVRSYIDAQLRGLQEEYEQTDFDVDLEEVRDEIDKEYLGALAHEEPSTEKVTKSKPPWEVVKDAIESSVPATEENIIEHVVEQGVSKTKAKKNLRKLVNQGEVIRNDGEFKNI